MGRGLLIRPPEREHGAAARPLYVHRYGSTGPPIVLLHGLGASGRYWRLVAERLAGDFRITCPDLLGFGRSPRPQIRYSVADHLAALEATLTSLGLSDEPIVLGGHSTGAILALEWAARSARFRGLALVALPVYRSSTQARRHIARISPLAWATVAQPRLGEVVCGVMCSTRPLWRAVMPLVNPGVPPDISRDFVQHDWTSYSGTVEHVLVRTRLGPAAAQLAASGIPVALLHGSRDTQAPIETARALAARHGWPFTVLAGTSHYLPIEAPEHCAELLRSVSAP